MRSRRRFLATALVTTALVPVALALGSPGRSAPGIGPVFMVGLWVVAAPFCGGWVGTDVRQGYAAFWLQKPIRPATFYLARLLALAAWSLIATLAAFVSILPGAVVTAVPPNDLAGLLLGAGWMPLLLVAMSFLGSGLGASNAALFAFAMLFGGFALPGFADALWIGPFLPILRLVLPPAQAGFDAMRTLRDVGAAAGIAQLWPLLAYALACALVGVAASMSAPARLVRAESS